MFKIKGLCPLIVLALGLKTLFNDTLNTFLFKVICFAHTTTFVIPIVEDWLEREMERDVAQ